MILKINNSYSILYIISLGVLDLLEYRKKKKKLKKKEEAGVLGLYRGFMIFFFSYQLQSMTYQTNEKQQTKHAEDFKNLAQGHGSFIMELTVEYGKSGIAINDPKADVKFAKIMKACLKKTQKYYPRV